MKCNWCHKRFTPNELKGPIGKGPNPRVVGPDGEANPTLVICAHAGIDMKFHADCYQLHVAKTH